jgi:hypothetical protein
MIRTHYISASSHPDIREIVSALAATLDTEWCLEHDWTKSFDKPVDNPTALAALDLECAVMADDFIFFDSHNFSRGAMMEYGARLAAGNPVLHIGCQDRNYLFFQHQFVTHLKDIAQLRSYLATR